MKAIIVTGGKQYTVAEGDVIFVEKLGAQAEETVKFEQVLAILDGENTKIGAPVVEGAAVEAKVVKNGKGKMKIHITFVEHLCLISCPCAHHWALQSCCS